MRKNMRWARSGWPDRSTGCGLEMGCSSPSWVGPDRWRSQGRPAYRSWTTARDLAKSRSTQGEATELLLVTEEQRRQQQVYGDGRRERLPGTWDLGATRRGGRLRTRQEARARARPRLREAERRRRTWRELLAIGSARSGRNGLNGARGGGAWRGSMATRRGAVNTLEAGDGSRSTGTNPHRSM